MPLMKLRLAAPSMLVDLRKLPGLHRVRAPERALADRRAHHALDTRALARARTGERGRGHDRRSAGPPPRHDRRLARPRRLGLRPARGDARHRGRGDAAGPRRAADARLRRAVRGLPDDRGRRAGGARPRSGCRCSTATGTATRSSTAAPRTGRWSACAPSSRRSGGRCEDVRIGLTNMGSVPLRATAAEDALRGQELSAENIAKAAAAARPRGPTRPRTSTPAAEYKRHLATGADAGGRSRTRSVG